MEVIMSGKSVQFLLLYLFVFLSQYMKTGFGFSLRSEVDLVNIKCMERERQSLLKIKQDLIDEYGHLSSWGNEEHNKNCCSWRGVSCSYRTGHVVSLNLQVSDIMPLRGKISASLVELQHLNYLKLRDNDFGEQRIPEFIGSLKKLRHLDLSFANFGGRVPYQLGNLSRLQSLDLRMNFAIYSPKLEWLSHLSSLKTLALDLVNLSEATDWQNVISGLPSLTDLQLHYCNLPSVVPSSSISFINSSTSLASLDLSSNNLSNSVYLWLFHYTSSLAHLNLGSNNFHGSIPDDVCNMTSLTTLDLSANLFNGIPRCFRNLCGLKALRLYHNNITGQLSMQIFSSSGCLRDNLEFLNLNGNSLSGPLPHFTGFLSLKFLFISDNRLNGTIPESIGQLSKLEELDISSNCLEVTITETHMCNLSQLKRIDFSFNSLSLNFSIGWTPPFQLQRILLVGCKLGPHFPKWLQTQNSLSYLDISDAGISDTCPRWFWALSPRLSYLNLSHNQISGTFPDLSMKFAKYATFDLSSNCFGGSIPPFFFNVSSLILSNNLLFGSISMLCENTRKELIYLDLSDNQLSGEMPDCLMQSQQLEILNLANNNFSGKIPNNFESGCQIWALDLHNNSLIGEFPSSLKNCQELTIIDLGNNKLFGTIPTWMGESLPNLAILSLQSNRFLGNMPIQLCNLIKVQILNFSHNKISGTIPTCLKNLTTMVQKGSSSATIEHEITTYVEDGDTYGDSYQGHIFLIWKGAYSEYKNTIGLVKSIDFSSNKLSGTIPKEITSLVGLISLNLSRNSLIGSIPTEIGKLNWLNTLDLSENQLSGKIPESFSQLDSLGVLNLSNNNLSGTIPTTTKPQSFNASSYMGNPDLCGSPLPNKCVGDEPAQDPDVIVSENGDGFITQGFYLSMVLGFIIGFWGVCGPLVLNNSCRYAYFQFLNDTKDKLYILVAVNMAKLQRKLRS